MESKQVSIGARSGEGIRRGIIPNVGAISAELAELDVVPMGSVAVRTLLKLDDIDQTRATLKTTENKLDKSATAEANSFLVVAQERLRNLRLARRDAEEKKAVAALGKAAYKAYCDVSEAALVSLYEEVEGEFGAFYRAINQDDEDDFKAKFEAANGKLGLLVDFHKKGMFPPGAYHSEGQRAIASAYGLREQYVSKIIQSAFLAPQIVESILDGSQAPTISLATLLDEVPLSWADQAAKYSAP